MGSVIPIKKSANSAYLDLKNNFDMHVCKMARHPPGYSKNSSSFAEKVLENV